MKIDNRQTIIKARKIRLFLTIGFAIAIILVFLLDIFKKPVFGIPNYGYIVILAGIYLLINIYILQLKLNYIYYCDEGTMLILRYFSLRMYSRERNSIEIPKKEFKHFELIESFFGHRKEIILFRKTAKGIAKYPPVSITSLNKTEKKQIIDSLSNFSQKI
ncbi:MAG: hypothetical protein HY738_16930 [Bacteroidia bacterium]|nr:hypothetical protein [Bacteroidia bacterium]